MKKLNKELSKKVVIGLALYSVLGMQSVWAATEVKPTANYSDNNVVVTASDWSLNGAAQGSQGSPYSYVYGGYSDASGVSVSGNKVSFSGNEIMGISKGMELYGGESDSDSGSASGNSVEIGSNSTLTNVLYIEGAYGEVSSSNNKILISGGEITGISDGMELYGGDSYSGSAEGNSVEIKSGMLTNVWYVEGAYSTNDATGNKLVISGGEITGIGKGVELYGGDSYYGSASGNSVEIKGGTLTNVRYIEGAYSTYDAKNNKLTVSGGEITGISDGMELFGGESYSGSATENSVEITGGTLTNVKAIYGGYSNSDAATGNTVSISAGTVTCSGEDGGVYGGYTNGSGAATNNIVNITGGTVDVDDSLGIIGGYSKDGDATGNKINISGGIIKGCVYAGKSQNPDSTKGKAHNNTMNISGTADLTQAYLYGYDQASKPHSGNTLNIASDWTGSVMQISNFDSVVNNGDLTVTDSTQGMLVSGNSMDFRNNGRFKGFLHNIGGGTLTFTNATGATAEAYGIYVTDSGTTTVDGSGAITISTKAGTGQTAYGIYVGSGSTLNIGKDGGTTQTSVTLASGTANEFDGTTNVYGKLTVAEGATMNFADGSMNFADGSTLSIDASNSLSDAVISGIDKASQLNITDGASLSVTNADIWQYYSVVSGEAVTDGSLQTENLWKSVTAIDKDGNKLCGDYEVKDGKVTVEIRNIPLAAEANATCMAGVQQGAITMVGEIAEAIGENVGLMARPAQDGVYDKTIWAKYISTKETVEDMPMWRGAADNTAKYHGVTLGADFYTSKKAIAGVALTYVTGDINSRVEDVVTNNDSKYYGISLYDRVTNGKSAWIYDLGYSRSKNDITQNSYQTITGDTRTNAYTLGAKYEYAYNFKHSALIPFASFRYLRLSSNDYTNSNGHSTDVDNQNIFVPKIGLTWTGDFAMTKSDWKFKPMAEIGYIWNVGDREAEGKFTSRNRAYDIAYDTVDKSSYYTKLGLNFSRKKFTGGVSYRYAKGDSAKQNGWNVNLSWNF